MIKKRKRATESKITLKTLTKKRRKPELQNPQINIGKLISDYLINSYLYYEKQVQIISDHEFDTVVDKLLENFDMVEASSHIHKHLIQRPALQSYTAFGLIGRFPKQVQLAALGMLWPDKPVQELLEEI